MALKSSNLNILELYIEGNKAKMFK